MTTSNSVRRGLSRRAAHFDKLVYQDHEYWRTHQEKNLELFNEWLLR